MPKAKKSKNSKSKVRISKISKPEVVNNNISMIIAIAIGLGILGYFGYRSMLTSPSVNKIDEGSGPRSKATARSGSKPIKPPATKVISK